MAFTPKADGWKLYAIYYLNTRTEMWAPTSRVALQWVGMKYGIAPGHEHIACRAFDITPA
jgi:hypothetical protein